MPSIRSMIFFVILWVISKIKLNLYPLIKGQNMKIENVDINKIKPYHNNPRKNDKAINVVAASIKEFGFRQPIVCDKNMVIIVGHTRYRAALKNGLAEVPVHIADNLTEAQANAYRIMDNKAPDYAEWDNDLLLAELKELEGKIDLSLTGFTKDEIAKLSDIGEEVDPDVATPETPISESGKVYQLGLHKLLVGDATKSDDYQKLMGIEKADLLLTDPPYNVDYEGKTKNGLKIENDDMDESSYEKFLRDSFNAIDTVLNDGACFYI